MKILLSLALTLFIFTIIPTAYGIQYPPDVLSIYKYTGTLTNTSPTPVAIPKQNATPNTITLSYANNTGRLVELSTDGGTTYFTPSYDVSTGTSSTAGIIVVGVLVPITHVRFTGANGDVWTIL